jgi:hypothetical protein
VAQLAARVPKLGGHVATIDLRPGLGLCVAKTGGPAHWSVWGRPLRLETCVTDRAAALDCLAGIAQAEPDAASEVFLIAQDDDGNTVGETVYASSVSVPA